MFSLERSLTQDPTAGNACRNESTVSMIVQRRRGNSLLSLSGTSRRCGTSSAIGITFPLLSVLFVRLPWLLLFRAVFEAVVNARCISEVSTASFSRTSVLRSCNYFPSLSELDFTSRTSRVMSAFALFSNTRNWAMIAPGLSVVPTTSSLSDSMSWQPWLMCWEG